MEYGKTGLFKMALALFMLAASGSAVFGWDDYTHMAIAKAAGVEREYTTVGPDMIKLKFRGENSNHFYDAERNELITRSVVVDQVPQYDRCRSNKGCLLGSVVASYRKYDEAVKTGSKVDYYYLGIMAHYIGDMGAPLHLSDYDDFNRMRHHVSDGMIDVEVRQNTSRITAGMKAVSIKSEEDIIGEVIRIADRSRRLAYVLRDENRDITKEEAYSQAALSSSLIKAVIKYVDERKAGGAR